MPLKNNIVYSSSFEFNQPPSKDFIDDALEHVFITLTFDQKFFLPKTESDQVNFFISILFDTIPKYTKLYGVFEYHKSGIVHFHGVFSFYSFEDLNYVLLYYRNKLTQKSSKSVNHKSVTNLDKPLNDYLKKENFITIEKKCVL